MRDETVLGLTKVDKVIILLFFIVIFGLSGWFIPVIANALLNFEIIPYIKIVEFIASFEHTKTSIIATIIGVIIAVIFAIAIIVESLKVTITPQNIMLTVKDKTETIDKKEISAIFMDKRELVILGPHSNELYREEFDVKKAKVKEAFQYYRYPWYDEDPYIDEYERWVKDHPDFPEKINALLKARQVALEDDETDEAKQLRRDLAKLGVVIKDKKKAQYVRMTNNHK